MKRIDNDYYIFVILAWMINGLLYYILKKATR